MAEIFIQPEIFYSETKKRNFAYIVTKFRLKGFRKTKEKNLQINCTQCALYLFPTKFDTQSRKVQNM